jgi:DNA-binding SARP family transcriptional activator/tetratricopeptide (TPR) repeat protein
MDRLELSLLGGLEARLPSGQVLALPGRTGPALLAYLAVRPGRWHARDSVAALLWPEVPATRARHRLRQTLVVLRQALAPVGRTCLLDSGEALAVDADVVTVDVTAFESAAAESTPVALERAVALYRGDFLAGLGMVAGPFEEWLLTERERLREMAVDGLARLLAHQMQGGRHQGAVETAGRLLAIDSTQEAVHRTLMRLHARQGRRSAALRQYESCVAALRRELGVEPEAETRRLYQDLLQERLPPEGRRPAPARSGAGVPDGPLIGRQGEIERLRREVGESQAGRGRVLVLLGEAGIGKSRLLAETVAAADTAGLRVLLGRAYESQQILPFGPWTGALRAGELVPDIDRWIGTNASWRGEVARLLPEVGEPPALPAQDYVRLFEAMARILGTAAAERPTLLALEDVHWADEMSLRFLAFLSRRVKDWPLVVAATAREEDLAATPALRRILDELAGEPHVAILRLGPLSRDETLALVEAHAPSGAGGWALPKLSESIWAVSAGNPFVAVESIHAARTTPPETEAGLVLPERVRETIERHLERLDERARHLAAVAAVVGGDFSFGLIQQAADVTPAEAAEAVETLVAHRILHVVEDRLDFRHDRIREVVYARLLFPRRQVLHAAVGRALEARNPDRLDRLSDRLAYHFVRADLPEPAVAYLARFADRAALAYAHGDAAAALRQAATFAGRLPAETRDRWLVDLAVREAFSLAFLGRFPETRALLAPLEERVERLADARLSGPYFFRLGLTENYLGDNEEAGRRARRAIEEAARCGDRVTEGRANYVLALSEHYRGLPLEGLEHARRAVFLLEGGQAAWIGLARWVLGLHHYVLGEFDAALQAQAEVEALGEAHGEPRLRSFGAWTRGWILATRGDGPAAIEACRRGLALSPDPVNSALASGRLGYAYVENGEGAPAIPLLEEAATQVGRFNFRQVQASYHAFLAEAHLLNGDCVTARTLATGAVDLARRTGFRYAEARAQRALGYVAQAAGDLAEAERWLEESLATFRAAHARFEVARTLVRLGEVVALRGGPGAGGRVEAARSTFAALGLPGHAARAEAVAARLGSGA